MRRPPDIFENVKEDDSVPSESAKIYLLIKVSYNGNLWTVYVIFSKTNFEFLGGHALIF